MNRLLAITGLVCLALACGNAGDGGAGGGEAGVQHLSAALYSYGEPCTPAPCPSGEYCDPTLGCRAFHGTYGTCSGPDGTPCHHPDGTTDLGQCVTHPSGNLCYPNCVLTDPVVSTDPPGTRCPEVGENDTPLSCYIFSNAASSPVTQLCLPPNASAVGEGITCTHPTDCAAGLQCMSQNGGTNGKCMLSCQTDPECTYASLGQRCNMASAGIGFCGPWDGTYGPCTWDDVNLVWTCAEGACVQESEQFVCVDVGCDPVGQDCPVLYEVQPACYFLSDPTTTPFDTACIMVTDPTPNQPGDACGDQPDPEHFNPSDCDKGSECIDMDDGNGNLCYAFCADNTDCTSSTTCLLFNAVFGVCACLPEDHMICGDNAVYWVDTCGILGAKVEDCSGTCTDGACVP